MVKECRRCFEIFPATPEYFYRNSQSKDGLHAYCKVCKSDIHKKYMKDPTVKERVINQIKLWRNTSGRDKYCSYRRVYDKSPSRVSWRRKKYNAEPRNFKVRDNLISLEDLERMKRCNQ
jgi:hypothetical protein